MPVKMMRESAATKYVCPFKSPYPQMCSGSECMLWEPQMPQPWEDIVLEYGKDLKAHPNQMLARDPFDSPYERHMGGSGPSHQAVMDFYQKVRDEIAHDLMPNKYPGRELYDTEVERKHAAIRLWPRDQTGGCGARK